MKLDLIKSAVFESAISKHEEKSNIKEMADMIGMDAAKYIFEAYQASPEDYNKWLDVIIGYAQDEGIKINKKTNFQEVAFAVLENDPAGSFDSDLQDAIVNKLWMDYKAHCQQTKIDKLNRVAQEEEQLAYAIDRMRNNDSAEDEQFLSGAGMEEEEDDFGDISPEDVAELQQKFAGGEINYNQFKQALDQLEYTNQSMRNAERGYRPGYQSAADDVEDREWAQLDSYSRKDDDYEEDDYEENDYEENEEFEPEDDGMYDLPFTDDEIEDERIQQQARAQQHAKELEDFDRASLSFQDEEKTQKFVRGQLVLCKKDNSMYKVEIPDGPGDMVGILVNGRIKMCPSKDLVIQEENEESTSKHDNKLSFLHQVLTGEKSNDHLKQLQKNVELDGANAWTTHHAKSPRNPHPKGSLAYKHWQRGFESAAKDVWQPKKVEVDSKSKKKSKR